MKALIVFREDDADNLFVHVLCQAIQNLKIDIHCSCRDFWEKSDSYDIIHFQWPEEVVGWNCTDVSVIERLKQRIAYFKTVGTKFVYTRHNSCPHYSNPVIKQAYEIIEACSDLVVHMGIYSQEEFKQSHPHSQNVIIPHHIYENTYDESITREEARARIGIPENKFVITAFGKFRNHEEINMVLKSYLHFRHKRKFLLAPRMLPFSKHPEQRNSWKRIASFIGYRLAPLLLKLKDIKAGASEELIDNAELPYYIAASDVILVQRKKILNSGNIPLAFLFRKVVIGPNVGNVGELLRETGNPIFTPDDIHSIVNALKQAKQLSGQGKGEDNYHFAKQQMNLNTVANAYENAYRSVLNFDL